MPTIPDQQNRFHYDDVVESDKATGALHYVIRAVDKSGNIADTPTLPATL